MTPVEAPSLVTLLYSTQSSWFISNRSHNYFKLVTATTCSVTIQPIPYLCACAGMSNRYPASLHNVTTFWSNVMYPYIFGLKSISLLHASYYFYLYRINSPCVSKTYVSFYAPCVLFFIVTGKMFLF